MIGYYIAAGVILLAAIVLIPSYVAYRIAFYNDPERPHGDFVGMDSGGYLEYTDRIKAQIKKLGALEYEHIYIEAHDGTRLHARYREARAGAPLLIQIHGYKGSPFRDFSEGADYAMTSGYNVLLVDQRAHGESGGKTITFGAKEKLDAKLWAEYATERFGADTKIILNGISMGATTVLLSASLPLPETVKGIVADCPYSSLREIISLEIKRRGMPPSLIYPFAVLGARIYGGFNTKEADVVSAIPKNSGIPVLLIHGEADDFVPSYMSDRIKAQDRGDLISYHTFPGALHGYSFFSDTERYVSLLNGFLEKTLQDQIT